MQRKQIEIINKLGMHARAAAKFVTLAQTYSADIQIAKNGQRVNGKSIMGVMMLAAAKGSSIELLIDGEDEDRAMQALSQLIDNRFDEDE
jgi:phosphocarrier protein